MKNGFSMAFATLLSGLTLCQCNTLKSDCEALAEREAQIAQEPQGDYFIGRRYYIPYTRLWGYVRQPRQSWRESQLVLMDESIIHTPDRGPEPPLKNAVYGTDQNTEYILRGSFTGEKAYDPSTDQVLPLFRATSYEVKDRKPGFLFVPSEKYSKEYVTLRPAIMPKDTDCAKVLPAAESR